MRRLIWLAISLALMATSCGGETPDAVEVAVLETTLGRIDIMLFPDMAPLAVENFRTLAERGYYDGILFHRVIPSFIIQGGDPTGTGRGGESIWGEPFADEFSDSLRYDRVGRVGMANRGPNTNTSQFFITLIRTPHLDNKHTIFGQVVNGMDVVRAIAETETDHQGRPITPLTIDRIRFIQAGWIGPLPLSPVSPSGASPAEASAGREWSE